MGSSPHCGRLVAWRRIVALAATLAFLCTWAHPLEAAAKKKKKKHPPAPTNAGEIDTPPPPAAAPASAPAPAPASSPPEAPPAPAAPPENAEAGSAPAARHAAAEADTYAPLGTKHTLVLDDLSGFRASTTGGIGYAGPIGFSTQSYSVNVFGATGAVAGTDTIHTTTIWFAPSADYFLFERISIGAVVELAWSASSYDQNVFGTTKSNSLPSTVSFSVIPRAGYMLPLAEHWGLWPRLGMGLGVLQQNAITQAGAAAAAASSSLTYLLDVDVGVLYRMDSRFYLRAGPEFTWGPGAALVDFSVAGGFGYMWTL